MAFQKLVATQPAPAVEGDFASANPRFSVLAGPGGLVAGPAGVTVGRFAWITPPLDPDGTPSIVNSFGGGVPAGFVHREQQATITVWPNTTSMTIMAGQMVTLISSGDFWARNAGSGEVLFGQKVYANNATGAITFAATGTPPSDFSMTGSVAAGAGSATTSTITDNVLTVQTLASGNFFPGSLLTGTGVASGTRVVRQLTGTANGVGTYLVSIPGQAVTSTTITGAHGVLTISAATTGTVHVGDTIAGSGVVAGTQVTALGTGTGGLGTYIVNDATVVASTTITGTAGTETKWVAMSQGAAGELIKISTHLLG